MKNAQHGTTSLSSRLFRRDHCCFPNEKSQIDSENDLNPKIFHFPKCLRNFRLIFERLRGLGYFQGTTKKRMVVQKPFPKILLRFFKRKCLKLRAKMTRSPKTFQFSKIFCIFSTCSTDFVDWNVKKGQEEENLLFTRLFSRVSCGFLSENVSN